MAFRLGGKHSTKPKTMRSNSRPRHERTREYLTPEEVSKLLAAIKQPELSRNPVRDYCLLLLMFRHGLRVSEICRLKVSDIDLETKILHVHRLKSYNSTVHPLYNGEPRAIAAWLALPVENAFGSRHALRKRT